MLKQELKVYFIEMRYLVGVGGGRGWHFLTVGNTLSKNKTLKAQ